MNQYRQWSAFTQHYYVHRKARLRSKPKKDRFKLALRPKSCFLAAHPVVRAIVAEKLQEKWPPQQIAGLLRITHDGDTAMHVSHETIYKSLFIQARGVLKKELTAHLRSRRIMRRGKAASTAGQTRGRIIDAVSIRDRPAEIEDRAVPGAPLSRSPSQCPK